MRGKLLTTREAAKIIGILEKELIDLANAGVVPHFKVAGEFLRFKKEDIIRIKPRIRKKYNLPEKKSRKAEKIKDFLYFNDFYLVSAVLIIFLLWVIVKDFVYTP
ncbi:MAG: hypothetical protein GF375_01025 [Candidatus Omnitrophica bacterium]|nr:hypothetical protein [Candidatus Omnitrophota bacterium]MBD3268720.1 hypothetical protein [Candidatus Omnitrophota bacterium]